MDNVRACVCGAKLKIPEGASGKCPKCGVAIFTPTTARRAVKAKGSPRCPEKRPLFWAQWAFAAMSVGWFLFGFSGPSDIQLLGSWAIAAGFCAAAAACVAARAVIIEVRKAGMGE